MPTRAWRGRCMPWWRSGAPTLPSPAGGGGEENALSLAHAGDHARPSWLALDRRVWLGPLHGAQHPARLDHPADADRPRAPVAGRHARLARPRHDWRNGTDGRQSVPGRWVRPHRRFQSPARHADEDLRAVAAALDGMLHWAT